MSRIPPGMRALRLTTVLSVAATATVLGAAPAFAHVTAQPGNAVQGSYSVVSLRVPNESDTAGTVKLEVTLPADHPLSSVRTTPVPGWTATTTKAAINPPVQVGEATVGVLGGGDPRRALEKLLSRSQSGSSARRRSSSRCRSARCPPASRRSHCPPCRPTTTERSSPGTSR